MPICSICLPERGNHLIETLLHHMKKLYYSISEVAEILQESPSLVRFWSNSFPRFIKPDRNAKGNRMYTEADIETLKQIHFLVKEKGLTLEGAAKELASSRSSVDKTVKAIDSLKAIREKLLQVKSAL